VGSNFLQTNKSQLDWQTCHTNRVPYQSCRTIPSTYQSPDNSVNKNTTIKLKLKGFRAIIQESLAHSYKKYDYSIDANLPMTKERFNHFIILLSMVHMLLSLLLNTHPSGIQINASNYLSFVVSLTEGYSSVPFRCLSTSLFTWFPFSQIRKALCTVSISDFGCNFVVVSGTK